MRLFYGPQVGTAARETLGNERYRKEILRTPLGRRFFGTSRETVACARAEWRTVHCTINVYVCTRRRGQIVGCTQP